MDLSYFYQNQNISTKQLNYLEMTKYLITGYSGFVAQHFLNYLESLEEKCTVLGLDITNPTFDHNFRYIECQFNRINLLDKKEVENTLFTFQPNYILHLASYSSVAYSWANPVSAFVNNTNIFLNLVDQVRILGLCCRILSVGSSEEYGNVSKESLPLQENLTVKPTSPYAVARVSQEMLSNLYSNSYNVDLVLTRSFNHIGPGQKDVFVISSFAKKLTDIKKSKSLSNNITVGNLNVIRDFLDVRDVVKAYYLLLHRGKKGEIYNICSGKGYSLKEILSQMMDILDINVEIRIDDNLIRPNENSIIIGCNKKIGNEIGWKPTISIKNSLEDIIDYWIDKTQ